MRMPLRQHEVLIDDKSQRPGLYTSPYQDITFTHHPRQLRVGVGEVLKMVNLLEVEVGDVLKVKPS